MFRARASGRGSPFWNVDFHNVGRASLLRDDGFHRLVAHRDDDVRVRQLRTRSETTQVHPQVRVTPMHNRNHRCPHVSGPCAVSRLTR